MSKNDKSSGNNQSLLLIARPGPKVRSRNKATGDRSMNDAIKKAGKAMVEYAYLSPEILQDELTAFLGKMDSVLHALPAKVAEFALDSLEISVEINAKG